jgi:hypothetical protein
MAAVNPFAGTSFRIHATRDDPYGRLVCDRTGQATARGGYHVKRFGHDPDIGSPHRGWPIILTDGYERLGTPGDPRMRQVWRFREKGALTEMPDSPASVGFALYLVDVNTGVRLWRGSFDGTQKALTEDVLGGLKQLGMGVHWLSAEELARYGVKSVLKTLTLN